MIKKIIPVLAAMAILVAACAPAQPAVPTLSPENVQGTAVAAAWTMVAMTQAAIPTATPLPPTETPSPTPLPTFTQEIFPTPTIDFALLPTATQASSGGGGTCDSIQTSALKTIRAVQWVSPFTCITPICLGNAEALRPTPTSLRKMRNWSSPFPKEIIMPMRGSSTVTATQARRKDISSTKSVIITSSL